MRAVAGRTLRDRGRPLRAAALAALLSLAWLSLSAGTTPAGTAPAGVIAPAASRWNDLVAVACPGPDACVAVGGQSGGALAEVWNGTAWRIVTVARPKGSQDTFLNGVSCPAVNACVAVGYYYVGINQKVLAEAWNGTAWKILATPDPAGPPGGRKMTEFTGVSCPHRDACAAVGWYWNTSDAGVTLAERWNGTTWKIEATPNPKGSGGPSFLLNGVSCRTPDACQAVGDWQGYTSHAVGATIAESWNGAAWKLQPVPNPKGYGGGILNGVSCPGARACAAVGDHDDSSGNSVPLAEAWNGTAWAIHPVPDPARASDAYLAGVSCPAADACTGVGYYYNSPSGANVALAERWDGSSWKAEAPADPTSDTILAAVACRGADACVAVGQYYNSSETGLTLAETWNGTTWKVQPTPNP